MSLYRRGKEESDRLTTATLHTYNAFIAVAVVEQPGGKRYYQSLNALGVAKHFLTSRRLLEQTRTRRWKAFLGPFITVISFLSPSLFGFNVAAGGCVNSHRFPWQPHQCEIKGLYF